MIISLDQALSEFRNQAVAHNDNIVKEIQSMTGILNDAKGVFEDAMRKNDLLMAQLAERRDNALKSYTDNLRAIARTENDTMSHRAKTIANFDQVLMSIESSMIALVTLLNNGETVDGHITSTSTTSQKQLNAPEESSSNG